MEAMGGKGQGWRLGPAQLWRSRAEVALAQALCTEHSLPFRCSSPQAGVTLFYNEDTEAGRTEPEAWTTHLLLYPSKL